MNMVEKILARASGEKRVAPGQIVVAEVDRMLMHDLSANFVTRVFREELAGFSISHPERIVFIFDHTFSPPTEASARALADVRAFAKDHSITHVFDSGSGSMHHVVLESGLWAPGEIIVGCDSHTTIYGALGAFSTGIGNNSMAGLGFTHGKAWFRVPEVMKIELRGRLRGPVSPRDVAQHLVGSLGEEAAVYKLVEYGGPFIDELPVEERLLFPLMTIDLGAKAGYIDPDDETAEYARRWSRTKDFVVVRNDPDVAYENVLELDVSGIEPQVACPPTVGNVRPVGEVEGQPIDVAEVGGSTGGRGIDLRTLARYLAGRNVHPDVRLQVVPASRGIYLRAVKEGIAETLLEAGATFFPPSAGSNQAVNMGAMTAGEAMISTQARNFPGRNGSPEARHYLASAATVAVSALRGKITDPRSLDLPGGFDGK